MKWTWEINKDEDCMHCLCFINELELGWYCAYHGEEVPHWGGGCKDWISNTEEKRE